MKLLDKFKLKVRNEELGKLVWNLLVKFCYVTLIIFVLITCFTFWTSQVLYLSVLGFNVEIISNGVVQMFGIVMFCILIISINLLRNKKWENFLNLILPWW